MSDSSDDALSRLADLRDTLSELISSCETSGQQADDGSAGTGTFADPFKFGVAGDTGQGFSIKVIGLVRPADTLIRSFNRFNDRPGPGQEYVRLTVEVFCNTGGNQACETNYFDFNLTGSKGVVYDNAPVVNDDDLDVTVFPGASGTGTLVFLVDSSDTDLRLIYNEGFGSVSDGVFFEAEPSPDSGVEITASSSVNIRSGPSTNAGVVGSLSAGSTVVAFGRNQDGSWLQIANGWVFASLVTADGDIMQLPITAQ